jgi:hypothetical protein
MGFSKVKERYFRVIEEKVAMLLGTWGTDSTHLILFSCVEVDGQIEP